MTEYKSEDGKVFASAEEAAAYYLDAMTESQRFVEDLRDLCYKHENLSPETEEALGLALESEMTEGLLPAMRECLRAARAVE